MICKLDKGNEDPILIIPDLILLIFLSNNFIIKKNHLCAYNL